MTTNKIIIEDLNFYYGKRQALKSINLCFQENKITCLIGASGSGKSTLLRVLNRIYELYPEQKSQGKIYINGINILENKINLSYLRGKVGMVFQKPTPFPMSIFENISFALKSNEKLKKAELYSRVEWALKAAALWDEVQDKLTQSALSLSGGQQQRLCLARTLAMKPEILLLDEPCSALDPVSTEKIEQTLLSLKSNYTIVMVTHNMEQTRRIADRIITLEKGAVVENMASINSPLAQKFVD